MTEEDKCLLERLEVLRKWATIPPLAFRMRKKVLAKIKFWWSIPGGTDIEAFIKNKIKELEEVIANNTCGECNQFSSDCICGEIDSLT